MNDLITIAIAHDATCAPGDEWFFHGMAKPYDVHGSLESTIDLKDKEILDRDMKEQANSDFNAFGCIMAFVFVVFLIGVAIWALT